ncbi:UDP-N-acetylglucosamine 2-epimerase [Bryobacterales bacterium F-183]|nr:UDP-N-acetylglucosamine 2-epimerase [Bryobacterales bacterium F-183]
MRVLFVFGTRPEAIKLCPAVRHMRETSDIEPTVCVTGQHRGLLDQVLDAFAVKPDYDLNLMQQAQTLSQSTSRILGALEPVLLDAKPDLVLVQGDTTTTFAGALAAFYQRIPVGHVEAGLRTWDLAQPFPEESNRVLTGRLATLHFAATGGARQNLLNEGVNPASVFVTGNTGIDAVLHVRDGLESGSLHVPNPVFRPNPAKKLILVTAHRRESFGEGFQQICDSLVRLSQRDDVEIVYPVHPNPNVRGIVEQTLRARANITLLEPLGYVEFVDLMRQAYILLTDSGGVQEEGPSLGKPILVMRDKTERPEAVAAGTVKLVGPHCERIVSECVNLLDNHDSYAAMSRVHNPYGDGQASARIASLIRSFFNN